MQLPFTTDQFLEVFAEYNRLFWMIALGWWFASLAVIILVWRNPRRNGRALTLLLSVLWLWNALAYHALLFARVNPAAWLFAGLFALQAVLFFRAAYRHDLRYFACHDWQRSAAILLVVYAFAYPFLTMGLGHRYPNAPSFAVPCPTAILTIGLLLSVRGGSPTSLVVVPMLWSIVGGSAAILLAVPTDYVLLAAGGTLLLSHLQRRFSVWPARAPRGVV